MKELYDLIIIGSGPAGLSAAIYAQRAKLNTITIEQNMMSGGQVINTYEVDNYPGLPGMNGFDLATKFREHAEKLGAKFVEDAVAGVSLEGKEVLVKGEQNEYRAKTALIATGATHRKLGVSGEQELSGKGVSYCATCDGAFFKNKQVAVVGGGDVAVEDAIFLARICEKVYVIHRRDELRAAKILQERLLALDNVELVWDTVVEEIQGESSVTGIVVKNVKTGASNTLAVNGVFIAVGILPNSKEFTGLIDMDPQGYIQAEEEGITSSPCIFAAGDVRTKVLRQIVTAVSDGANAITSIEKYLTKEWKL